jgi:hypothetical protein
MNRLFLHGVELHLRQHKITVECLQILAPKKTLGHVKHSDYSNKICVPFADRALLWCVQLPPSMRLVMSVSDCRVLHLSNSYFPLMQL